jgi:hypothetical protein
MRRLGYWVAGIHFLEFLISLLFFWPQRYRPSFCGSLNLCALCGQITIFIPMKPLIFPLAFLILSSHLSMAQQITRQEANMYADKLVEKQILSASGKQLLLRQLKNNELKVEHRSVVKPISYVEDSLRKESILQFCAMAFEYSKIFRGMYDTKIEQRIAREDSLIRGGWTMYPPGRRDFKADYIHPTRSTYGWTRTRTLNDFKSIGLINDLVYRDCLEKLKDSALKDEGELVSFMNQRSIYYDYYDFNKNEQAAYIDSLVAMGLLTTTGRQQLLNNYTDYKLNTIPDMLQFSDRYLLIDMSDKEPIPARVYPLIFEKIKTILPDFQYEHLTTTVIDCKESDLIRQDIKLSFMADGHTYTTVFFHNYRHEKYDPVDLRVAPAKIDENFHKGINKWLTDKESPYRLYSINIPDNNKGPFGGNKKGLLLLKEGEAQKISTEPNIISFEVFDTRMSRKNRGKFINDFSDNGFFSHLSKAEIDSAKEKVGNSDPGALEELLLLFPKTIVLFDWETGNLENPYEELTTRFALASRGAFTPTAIVDDYKKGWDKKTKTTRFGFSFHNKRYEKMLPFKGDWLDPAFLDLINKSLADNKVDGSFYYCLDNGQESGYIFLNKKQKQFVLDKYPDLIK